MHDDDALSDAESKRTVRWAVIGTGTIASQFARDLHYAHNVELHTVCSRSNSDGGAFMRSFGAEHAVTDIGAIAADPAVDAVYVATPTYLHAEHAIPLLAAGKPVLVEKPFALTAAEAAAVLQVARESGTLLMEAMWTTFLPAVSQMRLMIDYRLIGSIRSIWAELAFSKSYSPESRFFNAEEGGGSLLDLGVYPLSLALGLLGKPTEVYGEWQSAPSGADMSADIELRYGDAKARILCGFDREGANQMVIEGTKGALVLEAPFVRAMTVTHYADPAMTRTVKSFRPETLSRLRRSATQPVPLLGRQTERPFEGGGLQFEIDAFSNAVRQGRREVPRMPMKRTLMTLGIIDAVRNTAPADRRFA